MPVIPSRISEPGAVSRCRQPFLVAGTTLLLGLGALAHSAYAQLPDGACCAPVGTCTVTPQAACPAPDTWRGSGTSCTPNLCVPTGACCAPVGTCTVTTRAACAAPNAWQDPGTTCTPNACVPIGACCNPWRTCTITTQSACLSPDTWQGPGTVCAPPPCLKPPILTAYRFLSPDTLPNGDPRPLTREDTVILRTRWEVPNSPQLMDSLTVTADFSRLDPGTTGNDETLVNWLGSGQYEVKYPLSGLVSRRDSTGIRIPLNATFGTEHTTDRRVTVCLSNRPPVPVPRGTLIVRAKDGPYRSGDSLVIETVWESSQGLPLQVTASFAEVDTSSVVAQGYDQGNGVFLIRYRLPLSQTQMLPDGPGKLIPITARNTGCGQTTDTTLRINTDTEPPPFSSISIDLLPAVTTDDSVRVSGEAPQSVVVLLIRNKTPQERIEADTLTGRFSGMLELLPGENKIQVRGEDAAGNSTLPYPASPGGVVVTRIDAARLEVGNPYSRKDKSTETVDDIVLENPKPMDRVVVRIFNLEGDCLWEERPDPAGQLLDLRFHWAGTDRAGERAPQGYYLVRAEWREPDGKARSITKGLLLRD